MMRRALSAAASNMGAHLLLIHPSRQGLSVPALVERFGLDPAAMADVDGRIPLVTMARMWEEMPSLCKDPDLGIHMHGLNMEADTLLAQLCYNCQTFGAALSYAIRYQRINHAAAAGPMTVLSREGELVHLTSAAERMRMRPPTQAMIFVMSAAPLLGQRLTGRPMPMTAVTFRHPTASDERACREDFGVLPRFGAECDRLTMPASYLEYAVQGRPSNISLHILEQHAKAILDKLPDDGLDSQVRAAVCELLPGGDATLAKVAKRLRLTPRTLQRHLRDAGLNLSGVVDEVRHELALEYVRRDDTSLCDIAFALGFADQSAFTRAFRRWTARSPRELRTRRHAALPDGE